MREIKFRAWDKVQGKYIEVVRMQFSAKRTPILITQELSDKQLLTDPASLYIIEQYTGLKDKFGEEIYEGDIVERRKLISARELAVPGWGKDHTEIRRAFIVYEHGIFYGRSITAGINANYSWDELEADFEIIGNIHENPELLEGEK
jgi:uncharacterized phage protein (TIGR01671 family)